VYKYSGGRVVKFTLSSEVINSVAC
jgi:hypothetical protein